MAINNEKHQYQISNEGLVINIIGSFNNAVSKKMISQ